MKMYGQTKVYGKGKRREDERKKGRSTGRILGPCNLPIESSLCGTLAN